MPDGRSFRGFQHHLEAAAIGAKSPGLAGKARSLKPVAAFGNMVTQAHNHVTRQGEAGMNSAVRMLEHAAREITIMEVATQAMKDSLADTRRYIESKKGEGEMAKKDVKAGIPEGEETPVPVPPNAGDNFRTDPAAPPVSGESHPDPSQSNIGAMRAGKQQGSDVAAENIETVKNQDELDDLDEDDDGEPDVDPKASVVDVPDDATRPKRGGRKPKAK